VPYKVYITDPELAALGGLYVYLWICGADIKGDFILQISVQFFVSVVDLVGNFKALSFQIV